MKKKILHLVGGMDIGGTETMLMNLYRNMDREEFEFHFISYYGRKGYYDDEIESLGGMIIHLAPPMNTGLLEAVKNLYKVIKINGYDVIHTHTLFNCGIGVFTAWMAGTKIRISHAHTTFDRKESFTKKLYMKIMSLLINIFSTRLLACSNKSGRYLFGEKKISTSKYKFIPNYVDYKRFINDISKVKVKEELGIEKEIVIGHIGRLMEAKNHSFILKIIKNLKNRGIKSKALFVGDGNLRKEIEEEAEILGINDSIIITGMRNDTERLVKAMDIFLLPSIYEGFGLVLLEAQAAGIPCLVSEAIQQETDLEIGLMTKMKLSEGPEKWIDTILKILAGKHEISKAERVNAFKRKGYDPESIIKMMNEIYRRKV